MPQPDPGQAAGRLRAARRLTKRALRSREQRFLAEGPQAVREALARTGAVTEVFATAASSERYDDLVTAAGNARIPWHRVSVHDMAALSGTVTPQGVVAVCRFLDLPLADVTPASPETTTLLVICANVRDPGNAGTVIRCADAVGADALVLAGTSVDPYNGKCVRATAGSLFHLPLSCGVPVEQVVDQVRGAGIRVLAADASGDLDLFEIERRGGLDGPTAWLLGNEAWGLPPELAALADAVVRVPIFGRAESLNLATAAAVCLYASARAQRR